METEVSSEHTGKENGAKGSFRWRTIVARSGRLKQVRFFSLKFCISLHHQLPRLECKAYSILKFRISEKLGKPHPHPPKVGLVDSSQQPYTLRQYFN